MRSFMEESQCDYGTFVVTMKICWLVQVLAAAGLDQVSCHVVLKSNLTLLAEAARVKGRKQFRRIDSEAEAIDQKSEILALNFGPCCVV